MKRGDTIGPYEIVQRLGGQHGSQVYSAIRESRGALVALKIPDRDTIEVFKMKAEIAAIASHPNLVRTIEVGESGPLPFIAMELLEGIHLSSLVARGAPIHGGIAASIGRSIAEALHHLHTLQDATGQRLDVVHLDVNASHVVLTRDGDVKLLGYGVMAGRLQSTRPIDASLDIHALGVLLADMVHGTANQFLYNIIARAMATRPEDRFRSARELADALNVHLLTYATIRPELAIRQMISPLEPRALAEPSVGAIDIFSTDTRARTIDINPVAKPTIWGPLFWIVFALTLAGMVAFVVMKLWPRLY